METEAGVETVAEAMAVVATVAAAMALAATEQVMALTAEMRLQRQPLRLPRMPQPLRMPPRSPIRPHRPIRLIRIQCGPNCVASGCHSDYGDHRSPWRGRGISGSTDGGVAGGPDGVVAGPGGFVPHAGGSPPSAPVDVAINAVIVSGANSPWGAVQRAPGVRNVTVTGGIIALGKTPLPGEPPPGSPQPAWLRVVPDLRLLDGTVIPPVVPNIIDIRWLNCPIEVIENPGN